MATSNPDLAAQSAYAAGFRGQALITAVAIAGAESSYGADPGPSPTNDYGFWQINSPSHPQYSTWQLLSSPLYNAQAAYAISGGGTNFTPWTTYTSGAYKSHLSEATAAVNSIGTGLGSAAAAVAAFAASIVFPLGSAKYTETQGYSPTGHQGVDLAAPAGTPIYAAASGTIKSVGGDPSGFGNDYPVEVLPNGTTLTYGHASKSYVTAGQQVTAGQIIAAVGSEGDSTGNHLHFQVNLPNGASTDPLQWLAGQEQGAGETSAQAVALGTPAHAQLVADIAPGGSWDPLNWPGELASSAAGAVTSDIGSALQTFAGNLLFIGLKIGAVVTGGALIVLGLASTVKRDVSVPIPLPAPAAAGEELPLAAAAA